MIGVLIIPTGIGAQIGGYAGDANPVAKLIGACCDKLITHPNVVNASDINEMPQNTLYVEGSILDRFLEGKIQLRERHQQNKVLVVANHPIQENTINATSAARATIGLNAEILELKTPLRMIGRIENGQATGDIFGCDELIEQISQYEFDALAVHTPIEVNRDIALDFYRNGGLNPWGGVEAKVSKMIAERLNKPIAHAPLENTTPEDEELYFIFNEIMEPRIAAEAISNCYLHCVLKGLNKAPLIGEGLSVKDVDFMVSPYGCFGAPHRACLKSNIPVIVVKENKTIFNEKPPEQFVLVENYWETIGIIMSIKAGIHPLSVRRPLKYTTVMSMED